MISYTNSTTVARRYSTLNGCKVNTTESTIKSTVMYGNAITNDKEMIGIVQLSVDATR